MSSKMIPVEESFAEWREDPEYVRAYDALGDEFSLAAAMIRMDAVIEPGSPLRADINWQYRSS